MTHDPASDVVVESPAGQKRRVERYRLCPICWETRRGYGVAYAKGRHGTAYRCNGCAHTWQVNLRQVGPIEVDMTWVEVDDGESE